MVQFWVCAARSIDDAQTAPEAVGPNGRYLHRSPSRTMIGPRLVHKRQAPADLLIRKDLRPPALPAHTPLTC